MKLMSMGQDEPSKVEGVRDIKPFSSQRNEQTDSDQAATGGTEPGQLFCIGRA